MTEQLALENVEKPNALIAVIDRAAANPDVDVDKMERLLAMQERILDRESEQAFNESMVKAQLDMPIIEADSENKQTNSKYAKYEKINKAIKPVYTEHGFALSFGTSDSTIQDYIRVTCDVSHIAGHHKLYYMDLPPDETGIKGTVNKTKVHATASAHSYAKRYLAAMIFNVTIGGEDDDGNAAGGDTRSALEIKQEHLDYMALVREHWPSIAAVKTGIATQSYHSAIESWDELTNDQKKAIWKAPTKGGILTTQERAAMKSDQWGEARREIYGESTIESEAEDAHST